MLLRPGEQVEERKNAHINELMKQQEAVFAEIKNYYNDITANNLDLIKVGRALCIAAYCKPARVTAAQMPGLVA